MTGQDAIRVLIVDDHLIVREGLITLLDAFPDLVLAGEAANGFDAIELCRDLEPDIVLMDMMMPEMDGVAAIQAILSEYPEMRIIALTSFKERDMVKGALEAGAIGYLLKNISADELAEAIRLAKRGEPTLAPEATRALIYAATHPTSLGQDLTPREREVLATMAKGLSNAQIAEQLMISSSTVKNHVSNILSKLSATTRTEAVALAMQNRLIDED